MNPLVDPADVTAVLLVDGWYVVNNRSFEVLQRSFSFDTPARWEGVLKESGTVVRMTGNIDKIHALRSIAGDDSR